jgi:amidase
MSRYGVLCAIPYSRLLKCFSFLFCSSVADVELFCRTAFGVQDSLHKVAPVPYRDVELPSKLRFGYYTSGASTPY